jgi:hypothetical protein
MARVDTDDPRVLRDLATVASTLADEMERLAVQS